MHVVAKSKIIICTGFFYSGGTLVLSELCRSLRELGYDACLFPVEPYPYDTHSSGFVGRTYKKEAIKTFCHFILYKLFPSQRLITKFNLAPHFSSIFMGCRRQWLPFWKKDTIILYPESIYGNPLKARNVIRWQLYNYMFWDDSNAYSASDLFLGYREIFNDRDRTPDVENVCINSFDESLYRRYNFDKRSGVCYIIRKGKSRSDLPTVFDGQVIDDLSEEEKVKALNKCEYCISYDTQTFYSCIAAICGCKSIVVPEPGKTREDYRPSGKSYGVAWSLLPEEIDRALGTVDKLLETIRNYKRSNRIETERFVEIVENFFKLSIKNI